MTHQRAIEVLERAVADGEPEAARLLAIGYVERGRLVEAQELLVPLVDGGRTDLADILADVLADLGDAERAEAAYRLAVAEDDATAMNNFALFLADRGKFTDAVAMFQRAAALGDPLAAGNLIRTYLHDLHDPVTARTVAERYVGQDNPATQAALAEVCAELGEFDEAERLFLLALDRDDHHGHIDYAKFLEYKRLDLAAAEQQYRSARQVNEPSWGYHLGGFLLRHGSDDEAAVVLEQAAGWGDLDARQLLDREFE